MFDRDAVSEWHFSYKVSAEFEDQVTAYRVAESLKLAGVPREQVRVVKPNDANIGREAGPEMPEVAQAQFGKSVFLGLTGLTGLASGMVIVAVLVAIGLAVVRSSSVTTIALGLLYPVVAVFLAGAVSFRPDHDLLTEETRTSTDTGLWGVVAHCSTREQQKLIKTIIRNNA